MALNKRASTRPLLVSNTFTRHISPNCIGTSYQGIFDLGKVNFDRMRMGSGRKVPGSGRRVLVDGRREPDTKAFAVQRGGSGGECASGLVQRSRRAPRTSWRGRRSCWRGRGTRGREGRGWRAARALWSKTIGFVIEH